MFINFDQFSEGVSAGTLRRCEKKVTFCFPVSYRRPEDATKNTKCIPLLKWVESIAVEIKVHLEFSFTIFTGVLISP